MPIIPESDAPPILESDLNQLRVMVNDPAGDSQMFGDDDYARALESYGGELNSTASYFWGLKASTYSDLVNVNESGSSRNLGDLYKNALELQKYYSGLVPGGSTKRRTRIGSIRRLKIDSR